MPWPIQSISRYVRDMHVCLSVHVWKPRFPVDWKLLVKERTANIGIPLYFQFFALSMNFYVIIFLFLVLGSWKTNLLCLLGEFVGGGSLAVGVGVIDR